MSLVVAREYQDHAPPNRPPDDDALIEGLRQRASLFGRILADMAGPRTVLQAGQLPEAFVQEAAVQPGARRFGVATMQYGADLLACPDRVWRVAADLAIGLDGHPLATLFDAPGLAVFLPGLCRFLLGESLRLASVPARWLGDPEALREVVQCAHRWAIVDAFRSGPAILLSEMTVPQRTALQRGVDAAPWRFVARLFVEGPSRRIFL